MILRHGLLPALMVALVLSCSSVDRRQASDRPTARSTGANLAVVAETSTNNPYASRDLKELHDDVFPIDPEDRVGSFRAWTRDPGTHWAQYEWSRPISTTMTEVYWVSAGRWTRLPESYAIEYWDGAEFRPIPRPVGLGIEADCFNQTTFDEIETTKMRIVVEMAERSSFGIYEWRVYDHGSSPTFPPKVSVGEDRIVVSGGRTYLDGGFQAVEQPGGPKPKVNWSKASGPGEVDFEDRKETETSATFSAPGEYSLTMTVTQGDLSASASLTAEVVPYPAAPPLEPVHTTNYKIDSPLWNHRMKALIASWVPYCSRKMSDPEMPEGGIVNFVKAAKKLAGATEVEHQGLVFANGWVYNTVEAMSLALLVDANEDPEILEAQEELRKTLDDWIPKIISAQEPDGYLQTAYTIEDRERWTEKRDHEGYLAGYLIDAGVTHYIATNHEDPRLYAAAKRIADCWVRNIGPPPKKPWYNGHQGMEMALVRLGALVNEHEGPGEGAKYIDLAKFLLDSRDGGSEYDQSHCPVTRQYEAVGHAVRAAYSYAGMADVAIETGDADYHSAILALWNNIVNKKYYVTGGLGSGESAEGFGGDYSLRQNSYCESCAGCGMLYFQHKMNRIHQDAKYADLYEDTIYNNILGSIDLEGENFYYQNPLDSGRPRYDWHTCPCCVGNIPRTLFQLPTWMYLKSGDALYVNLFVGSTVILEDVAGTDVEIIQKTDYPWSGEVSITVNPEETREFALKVRVPNREVSELYDATPDCNGIDSISLNGEKIRPKIEKGYATIGRVWRKGDQIDLVLPIRVQRIKGIEEIEATRGKVALRYGPLIYNIEKVDAQDIRAVLPPDSELTCHWEGRLLQGVVVIEGQWADGSKMTAIPNWARNNRGQDPPAEKAVYGGPDAKTGSSEEDEEARQRKREPSSIVWIADREQE